MNRGEHRDTPGKGGFGPGADKGAGAYEAGVKAGWVSVTVNVLLFAVKLVLGLISGSIALVADAVHTLADCLTSLVLIAGSYVAMRPPDREHPFGHGRAEAASSLVISVLLAVTAVEFGKTSVQRMLHPVGLHAQWWMIAVVALTAPVKEILARYALGIGTAARNQAVVADAWHHRSDAVATVVVAAGMAGELAGWPGVDSWVGLAVSVFIAKVAFDIGKGAFDSLLGRPPEEGEVEEAVQGEGEVAEGSQTELPAEETDPGETGKEQGGS